MLPSLQALSDNSLLDYVKNLKQIENRTVADLVLYLSEVDGRKLYRDIGYSSLFAYCTKELGYSEGAAYRRIQAARSLEANPEIYELLKDGKLSLCAVAEISKVISNENKTELLESSQGKAKVEVQKLVVQYQDPVLPLKKEKVVPKKVIVENKDPIFCAAKACEETRYTITVEVDAEFMELLKEAKDIVGFAPTAEVLKRTLKDYVVKRKSAPKQVRAAIPKVSRYIPKLVAHEIRVRDQNQCSFVSPEGRRCSETCGLEFDHIRPFALGGTNEASNLRLLCSSHNQLFAERSFGREKIESYRHQRK